MYKAKTKNGEDITIAKAEKGEIYICPFCKKELYVKTRIGKAFFCHKKNQSCIDNEKHDESDWANHWRERFEIEDIDKLITNENETHYVDVLINDSLAIMFNSSFMRRGKFVEKTRFIINSRKNLLWLFNCVDKIKYSKIVYNDDKILKWHNRSKMFENYQFNEQVIIVLEMKDDSNDENIKAFAVLKNVCDMYDEQRIIIKRWLTRKEFIRYFNDIAKGIDPEKEYIEKEQKDKEIIEEKNRELYAKHLEEIAEYKKRQEERAKEEEDKRNKIIEELNETKRQQEREKAEIERKKEEEKEKNAKSIIDLWNINNPKSYLIVKNIKTNMWYKISENPQRTAEINGICYGCQWSFGETMDREKIKDYNENIWEVIKRL